MIESGWVAAVDGTIVEIGEGRAPERGLDLAGDLLMPGLVELHTDHIEAHYMPRPKVYWDPVAAVVSYDGQLAISGITTVFDSLRVWREEGIEEIDGQASLLADAIASARQAQLLRVDHFLHLRCEVPMPSVVQEAAELFGHAEVRLVSLMDHTPGQRQFRDDEKLRLYYPQQEEWPYRRGAGSAVHPAQAISSRLCRTELPRANRLGPRQGHAACEP